MHLRMTGEQAAALGVLITGRLAESVYPGKQPTKLHSWSGLNLNVVNGLLHVTTPLLEDPYQEWVIMPDGERRKGT